MGDNSAGQLGLCSEKIKLAAYPTLVTTLAHLQIVSAAAGQHHSTVLTSNNQVLVSGSNKLGQIGLGSSNNGVFEFTQLKLTGDNIFVGPN